MSFPQTLFRLPALAALLVLAAVLPLSAQAQDAAAAPRTAAEIVNAIGEASLREIAELVVELAATGEPAAASVLSALEGGDLYADEASQTVVIVRDDVMFDPVSGAEIGPEGDADLSRIRVNNSLRRDIRTVIGELTLMNPDPRTRSTAAASMFRDADPDNVELLNEAIDAEPDAGVKLLMEQARAASLLQSELEPDEYAAAIAVIADRGDREALAILNAQLANVADEQRPALEQGIADIEQNLALWNIGQNVWYGMSLGSVLLLAAIGLAITFGVMGVINMAHGEMVMLGAYATFVVQDIIRTSFPGLFDYSLLIAVPVAFLATGLVGIAIERGIIRWLYGRPLETLLATWGLSLIIQQAVRTIFGPTNKDVGNPSWMTGAFDLGGLSITYSRMWIVVFAIVVFALLLLVLSKTSIGLQMRAVTQNRRMAAAIGIRTPWVDALTFGLGSGIAGIAGVALSQIDNVSPNLGQGYIIDSFMVVVFGGVGNLWGTLVGAMTLGIANKFLEPFAGAVLAKIVILICIILFIQRRPRGLFALKGRAVEQ